MTNKMTYTDLRYSPDENEVFKNISSQFAKAFGYTATDLTVDPQLAQALRLRVAQLNNCTYCMALHAQAARDLGIHSGKVDTLSAWWETALFSAEEQVALAYTEALTLQSDTNSHDRFADYHAKMTKLFTQRQIAEIASIVINMNLWTRYKMATGSTPTFDD